MSSGFAPAVGRLVAGTALWTLAAAGSALAQTSGTLAFGGAATTV